MTTFRTVQDFVPEPRFSLGAGVSLCLIVGIVASMVALAFAGVDMIEW